jgi:hypothetical protein
MQVIWEGEIFDVAVNRPTSWSFSDIGYNLYHYNVRATATPSPLSFKSLENSGFGVYVPQLSRGPQGLMALAKAEKELTCGTSVSQSRFVYYLFICLPQGHK